MPSKSKAKGSSFEREVAAYMSSLYSESFVRVPNSGAYIGKSNSHRKTFLDNYQVKNFKGDIIAPDSWSNFNSEAKNYADFPFHQVLTGSCRQLDEWLEQLMAVADKDDVNILFFKITRKGRFVAVQTHLTWVTDSFIYYSSAKHKDWLIIDFERFFTHNKDILKLYSQSSSSISSNQTSPSTISSQISSSQSNSNILSINI